MMHPASRASTPDAEEAGVLQVTRSRHGQRGQDEQREIDAARQLQSSIGPIKACPLLSRGHTVAAGHLASHSRLLSDNWADEQRPANESKDRREPADGERQAGRRCDPAQLQSSGGAPVENRAAEDGERRDEIWKTIPSLRRFMRCSMNGWPATPRASTVGCRKKEDTMAPPNQIIADPTCTILNKINRASITLLSRWDRGRPLPA